MSGRVENQIKGQSLDSKEVMLEESTLAEDSLLGQKLDWMLQLSQSINFNFSRKTLLDSYHYVLNDGFEIKRYALLLNEGQWEIYAKGVELCDLPEENFHRLEKYYAIDHLEEDDRGRFCKLQMVVPVIHKDEPLAYLLLDKAPWPSHLEKNHLQYLQAITNIISIGFENKRLFKNAMQQELIKHDLELARRMQEMLVQDELPDRPELRLASTYIPDRQVGGDYFDCQQTGEHEWYFCVADVSGKGIAASLLMANFQANLRSLLLEGGDLSHMIKELNKRFFKYTKGDGFITLFLGKLNTKTGVLDYVNAGHVPPVIANSVSTDRLKGGCTILGAFEELPTVNVQRVILSEESLIVAFTDGVSEIKSYEAKEFGGEGMRDFTKEKFELPIERFNDELLKHLQIFKGSEDFEDDVTILSLRYRPKFI